MSSPRHQRLKELFIACCNLDPAQRSAELDRRCGEDLDLRTELEALLEQDAVPFSAIDVPVFDAERDDPVARRRLRIGGYEILGTIGEGGMGVVYHAEQANPQRVVALKLLRSALPTSAARERFGRECSVLARFDHQGIAKIFEAGTYESSHGSQPWFAMEFVDGLRLTEYVIQQKLSIQDTLELVVQVCHAVHHAHERGVLHRDLKPANLLVNPAGQVKVIDFGIARTLDDDEDPAAFHTLTGESVGTPMYMSPEQIREDPGGLGVTSDIYSLGVVLFELCVGQAPYELRGLDRSTISQVICEVPPLRPTVLRSDLDRDLEAVLLCTLEKDPSRRYASARLLADDLERCRTGQPVHARPPSRLRQARAWARSRPMLAGLFTLTLVVILAGGALGVWTGFASWRQAAAIERDWADGDLAAVRGRLASLPAWARPVFLPAMIVDQIVGVPDSDHAVRQVLDCLAEQGDAAAWLLAARFVERDGLAAHPVLGRYLAHGLGSMSPSRRETSLSLVARLFFERPDISAEDLRLSAGFRARLEPLCAADAPHLSRLRAMTALSGCGDADSVAVVAATLENDHTGLTVGQVTEERRLGIYVLETLVRRGHRCGYLAGLYRFEMDEVLSRARRSISGSSNPGRAGRSLEALFEADAIARRKLGIPASVVPVDVGPGVGKCLIRAIRGEQVASKRLIDWPDDYPAPRDRAWAGHLLNRYAFGLESSGLYRPGMPCIELAITAVLQSGLTRAEAEELVGGGIDQAHQAREGRCDAMIPDLDTHLGVALDHSDPPWQEVATQPGDSASAGILARWDLSGAQPRLSAGARSLRFRSLRKQSDEFQSQTSFRRLGLPGVSCAELGFWIETGVAAVFEIDIRKATRSLLPYLGEAYIEVQIDGAPFGVLRVESIDPTPIHLALGRDAMGAGPHRIEILLGTRSNATLRLFGARVIAR